MIFILFFMVIMLFLFAYKFSGKDIFSPSVISCAMYILSIFFVLINFIKWDADISPKTVFAITGGLSAFMLGELLARILKSKVRGKVNSGKMNGVGRFDSTCGEHSLVSMPKFLTTGIIVFLMITIFVKFREVYQISILAGNRGGYATMLKYYRSASVAGIYSVSAKLIVMNNIAGVIGGWYLFVFLFNKIYAKKRVSSYLNLIPIVLYLILAVLSASRSQLIYYTSTALVMSYIFWQRKYNWNNQGHIKYLKKGVIAIAIFFVVFSVLGTTTGRINTVNDAIEQVCIYTGGSILALDKYLDDFEFNYEKIGEETSYAFRNYLSALGFDVKTLSRHREFINVGEYRTNVYTALRSYINDYGYLGMIIIQTFIGMFYTTFYLRIKYRKMKNINLKIFIYSSLFYPLVIQAISEMFFKNIFTITTLGTIICYYFLYKIFAKKSYLKSSDHMRFITGGRLS